jgi:hypothetical protein
MSDDDSFHDAQSRSDADGGSSSDSGADDHPLFGGDPTGVYAPYLQLRQEQQRAESSMIPLPPRVIGSWKDNHVDIRVCKCRKSNCLKVRIRNWNKRRRKYCFERLLTFFCFHYLLLLPCIIALLRLFFGRCPLSCQMQLHQLSQHESQSPAFGGASKSDYFRAET